MTQPAPEPMIIKIQRYTGRVEPNAIGEVVFYDDHLAVVARMQGIIDTMQTDLNTAAEENAKLVTELAEAKKPLTDAAQALVDALDAVTPAINNAFVFSAIHGGKYDGPTYGKQLEALRELLASRTAPEPVEQHISCIVCGDADHGLFGGFCPQHTPESIEQPEAAQDSERAYSVYHFMRCCGKNGLVRMSENCAACEIARLTEENARLKALLKRSKRFLFAATGFDEWDDEQRDLRESIEGIIAARSKPQEASK